MKRRLYTDSHDSHPNVGRLDNVLEGIAARSPTDIWAVGWSRHAGEYTLIEHWNGSTWSVSPSQNPSSISNVLYGVAMVPARDAWAVGGYRPTPNVRHPLIEHWNGSTWSIVHSPNVGSEESYLTGVAAVSSRDVWAGGNSKHSGVFRTLIEHWNGSTWSIVHSPNVGSEENYLEGVAAVSSRDVDISQVKFRHSQNKFRCIGTVEQRKPANFLT